MDNLSANDVLARTVSSILMQKYGIHFTPKNGQINCVAHVVNLVVQAILAAIEEAEDPDIQDYFLSNKDLPIHYDPSLDDTLCELENEVFEDREDSEQFNQEREDERLLEDTGEYQGLSVIKKVSLECISIIARCNPAFFHSSGQ